MIRRLAACIAATVMVVLGAAPAHADTKVGFSTDGVHWSQSIGPLFAATMRWVPGDSEQASFYVRNQGPTDGEMTVDVLSDDLQGLVASGALVVQARVGTGVWTPVGTTLGHLVPAVLGIGRSTAHRVTVRASFQPTETARMDQSASFKVQVTMYQGAVKGINVHNGHGAGAPANGAGAAQSSGDGHGGLPNTGSPITTGLLWFATALIGTGIALVARRRREARDD